MTSTAQLQVESPEGFRISPQQRRVWEVSERHPQVPFAAQCHVRIIGPLNVERLDKAIHSLRRTHEILRTRFVLLPGTRVPVQVIGENVTGLDQKLDLQHQSSAAVELELERIAETLWKQAGTTHADAGVNFTLAQVSGEGYVLLVTSSGLCADVTGLSAIVSELRDAYSDGSLTQGESLQFADISEWQNQILEGEAKEHNSYWKSPEFSAIRFPHLPFERRNLEPANFNPAVLVRDFSAYNALLPALASKLGNSTEAVLLAIYQVLISRLSSLEQFLLE